ncbi:MAG TPA: hypothetical protein ENJ09_03875 [Planctomycetes bacterium]|nr:hypothetical protein [Planctomycetota bacterium]
MDDPAEAFPYDFFDQTTGRVGITLSGDEALDTWTLAHELAHAYQWAFDPLAYEAEPSWIHEGLAEYLVYVELGSRDPTAARAFLEHAARETLARGLPFERVFSDVYAASWERTYPVAMLAIALLAREPEGPAKLRAYFRAHGPTHPARALRRVFGFGPRELSQRVERLAHELGGPGSRSRSGVFDRTE